mgnify:CR=1 FL=1
MAQYIEILDTWLLDDGGETVNIDDAGKINGGDGDDDITATNISGFITGGLGNDRIDATNVQQVNGGGGRDLVIVRDAPDGALILGDSDVASDDADVIELRSALPEATRITLYANSSTQPGDTHADVFRISRDALSEVPEGVTRQIVIQDAEPEDQVIFPDVKRSEVSIQVGPDAIHWDIFFGNTIVNVYGLELDPPPDSILIFEGNEPDPDPGFDFFQMPAVDQATAMYLGFFGRPADQAGQDFWVLRYGEGRAQGLQDAAVAREMASGFRFSNEAQDLFPFLDPAVSENATTQDIETFVTSVFDNLYNRAVDPEGGTFWVNTIQERLASNENIGDLIIDIMAGTQGGDVDVLANKIDVAQAYTSATSPGDFDVPAAVDLIGSVDGTQASVDAALAVI